MARGDAVAAEKLAPEDSLGSSTLGALYFIFVLTGVVTALLGPILPLLQLRFAVNDQQAGLLFVAQFTGSSLGALFSQRRLVASIAGGTACVAAGLAAFAFASWSAAIGSIFLYGFGLGLAIPATNMLVSHAQRKTRAASLNILNLAWGVGAAACPLIVAGLVGASGLRGALLAISAMAVAAVAGLSIAGVPRGGRAAEPAQTTAPLGMLGFSALMFLYVGVESSIGGWAARYARALHGGEFFMTASVLAFWAALLGGRAAAPRLLRRCDEALVFRVAAAIAWIAAIGLAASRSPAQACACAFLAGAGLSPMFALYVARATHYAERRRAGVPGWLFSLVGMGGAVLPWSVGAIAGRSSLHWGLLAPAAAALVCFAAAMFDRPSPPAHSN